MSIQPNDMLNIKLKNINFFLTTLDKNNHLLLSNQLNLHNKCIYIFNSLQEIDNQTHKLFNEILIALPETDSKDFIEKFHELNMSEDLLVKLNNLTEKYKRQGFIAACINILFLSSIISTIIALSLHLVNLTFLIINFSNPAFIGLIITTIILSSLLLLMTNLSYSKASKIYALEQIFEVKNTIEDVQNAVINDNGICSDCESINDSLSLTNENNENIVSSSLSETNHTFNNEIIDETFLNYSNSKKSIFNNSIFKKHSLKNQNEEHNGIEMINLRK